MKLRYYKLLFSPLNRGIHLITEDIIHQLPKISEYGSLKLFIKYTPHALTLNEKTYPTVREYFNNISDILVSEVISNFKHTYEVPDDKPAHIKASIT